MDKFYLSLDIGATKTAGAMFGLNGRIIDDYVYVSESQTFKGSEEVYQNTRSVLTNVIEHFGVASDQILGIGVGSPGPLDSREGVIIHAPLMRWKNFPIVRRLKDDFCEVVMLDNDGNLGAFAEQRCGVAQGLKHVLYMTVSSGCGGGLLIDGEIYHGAGDGAAEVGHMSIDPEGPPCPCGSKGCFELYASGTALIGFMKKDMASGVKSRVFELAGYEEERLNGELLTLAARERDAYALELYRREGYYLGVGLSNLINLFDPQAVVLGGGVTKAAGFFEKELISTLKKRCIQSVHDGLIRYSKLNDLVILHGAYFMIKEYMEKNKLEEI